MSVELVPCVDRPILGRISKGITTMFITTNIIINYYLLGMYIQPTGIR